MNYRVKAWLEYLESAKGSERASGRGFYPSLVAVTGFWAAKHLPDIWHNNALFKNDEGLLSDSINE